MSTRVAVTAVDAITSLGDELDETFANLVAGRTGFRAVDRFDTTGTVNRVAAIRSDDASVAAMVGRLVERLAAEHGPVEVDRAYFAGSPDEDPPTMPPVISVTGGGWDRVYTGACVSSSSALVDAASAIRLGTCRRVLVVAARRIDVGTFHVFSAGGAMTREEVPRPLTTGRAGVLLGDGAALFLLEAQDAVGDRTPILEVSGWGRAGDGFHAFQPEPSGRGMVRAIRDALSIAGLPSDQVDHVSVHGSGTELGDAAEAAALDAVFGTDAVPPVHAPKAALGHLLEGCGLVEAAVAGRAITASVLPPTAGVRAGDEAITPALTVHPVHGRVDHALTVNLAFGGCNTAVVLSRWQADADRDGAVRADAPGPGGTRDGAVPSGPVRNLEVRGRADRPGEVRAGRSGEVVGRGGPRRLAAVGANPAPVPVPGFIESDFPAAVHDAARRCLASVALTDDERAATAVLLLAPRGDAATKSAVLARVEERRRLPPPLFVQSTPSSILGRVAQNHGLRGAITTVSTTATIDDPAVVDMVAEMAAADGAGAVLVIRHLMADGTAEAVLYAC